MKSNKTQLSQAILLGLSTIIASSMLVACGSSDDRKKSAHESEEHDHNHEGEEGHDHEHDEAEDAELAKGRLLITEADSGKAHVFSIAENKVIQTIELGEGKSLQTSPEGKYAIVSDRKNNKVNFYHSGLSVENHGDHSHLHAGEAKKISFELNHTKPTHYHPNGEYAGIFFDGEGEEGNPVDNPKDKGGFVVISDELITEGKARYQEVNTNIHGMVEPRGDEHVLSVSRHTADTSLSESIDLYHYHADEGRFEKEKTFDSKCPDLHGSASAGEHSIFACSDGVVIIDEEGKEGFKDTHVPNSDVMKAMSCKNHSGKMTSPRFGSFIANNHEHTFVSTGCGQPFEINPEDKSINPIMWTTDTTAKVAGMTFDAHGEHLLLLDKTGKLHILDAEQNYKPVSKLDIFPEGIHGGGHHGPKLLVNPNTHLVYIADEEHKKLIPIDVEEGKVLNSITLGFAPESFTWFGIAKEHDHEHNEHGHEHKVHDHKEGESHEGHNHS